MSARPPLHRGLAWTGAVGALAVVYFLAARLGLSLGVAEQVTAVWPPTGIALAAVLVLGRRVWPGIWIGALAANLAASEPLGTALGIATGNTLEALFGAWLLHRTGFARALDRLRDVLALVLLAASFAPVLAATIGVVSLCLGGVQPWPEFATLWSVWWLGDAMGALIVTPLLLVWTRRRAPMRRERLPELGLLLAGCAAVAYLIFARPSETQLGSQAPPYEVFPFVIWAALRFGQRGTSLVIVIVSGIAVWATARGLGTFGSASYDERWLELQEFMAVMALTGLMLGAAIGERDRNQRQRAGLLARERRARSRAEALAEDLRAQQAAKDQFLAMLGHELRNPLAPVSNALQVLLARGGSDAGARELHALMERQVRHMARLVDDLLDVSRIGRGKIELRHERVDLGGVLDRAVESNRPLITEQRHRLAVSKPAAPVHVRGDPTRLEQILSNLLNNAARYTPAGGAIELHLERAGGVALLRVRDSGIGIKAEDLARLFEVFVQADRVAGSVQEGLGVGLTLVRKLAELHGGTAEVSSDGPGRGSTFVVRLPLDAAEEAPVVAGTPAESAPAPLPASRQILVVDDNEDSAETLAMLLRLEGHETSVAHDGPQALARFRALQPDVVFLDITLPRGMSGHDLARHMAAEPGAERVLLVAVTGYGQAEDRERSRAAGFHHHLVKPVDPAQLRRILRELDRGHGARSSAP